MLPGDVLPQVLVWISIQDIFTLRVVSKLVLQAGTVALQAAAAGSLDLVTAGDHVNDDTLMCLTKILSRGASLATPSGAALLAPAAGNTVGGLAISSIMVTDQVLQNFVRAHGVSITRLALAGCSGLTDPRTVMCISAVCCYLECLDLSGCGRQGPLLTQSSTIRSHLPAMNQAEFWTYTYSDALIIELVGARGAQLMELKLFDCLAVSDSGAIAAIQACVGLRVLDLGCSRTGPGASLYRRRITDRTILALAGPRLGGVPGPAPPEPCGASLVSLGLRGCCDITAAGIAALATAAPKLHTLDLAAVPEVTDAAAAALASLVWLTDLNLSYCTRLSDAGVRALAKGVPGLRIVALHNVPVTDSGVRALCRSCLKLERLNLSLCAVTSRVIRSLLTRDSLKVVNLRCCVALQDHTQAGVAVDQEVLTSFRKSVLTRHKDGALYACERPEPPASWPPRQTTPPQSHSRCAPQPLIGGEMVGPMAVSTPWRLSDDPRIQPFTGERTSSAPLPPPPPAAAGDLIPPSTAAAPSLTEGAHAGAPTAILIASQPPEALPSPAAPQEVGGAVKAPRVGVRRGTARSSLQGKGEGPDEGAGEVPFDWEAAPRGCGAVELALWRGFKGLPGDVAAAVVKRRHPSAYINFLPKGSSQRGLTSHGVILFPKSQGVVFEVDEQGCVV